MTTKARSGHSAKDKQELREFIALKVRSKTLPTIEALRREVRSEMGWYPSWNLISKLVAGEKQRANLPAKLESESALPPAPPAPPPERIDLPRQHKIETALRALLADMRRDNIMRLSLDSQGTVTIEYQEVYHL